MTLAPASELVLTNIDLVGVVILNVEENPEPPCVAILEVPTSSDKARTMAGSIDELGILTERGLLISPQKGLYE